MWRHPESLRGNRPAGDSVDAGAVEMDPGGRRLVRESCCSRHSLAGGGRAGGGGEKLFKPSQKKKKLGKTVQQRRRTTVVLGVFTCVSLRSVDKVITWVGGGGHVLPLSGQQRVVLLPVVVGVEELLEPLHKLKVVLELALYELLHRNYLEDGETKQGKTHNEFFFNILFKKVERKT